MEYIGNHGYVQKLFNGSDFRCGYYAFVELNGQFVIGEERGREGGELYRGEYKGENTPWLLDVKNENLTLYKSIVRYFAGHANNYANNYKSTLLSRANMTDMEKLREIFYVDSEKVKKQFPELYYAILAVLDKEKKPMPVPFTKEFCAEGYTKGE